jgi:predicted deacylase
VAKAGGTPGRRVVAARDRRVAIGGELLDPGRHVLRLGMPAAAGTPAAEREVALGVVVGRKRGPRAFVIGGTSPHDGSGLAVARGLVDAIDPEQLAGSVLALGLADSAPRGEDGDADAEHSDASPRARAGRWLLALLTGKAAFGVEVRSGPAGRTTYPHLRADLREEGLAALARAFGNEIVVDTPPRRAGSLRRVATAAGVPTLVFEGGELGRFDGAFVERAIDGVVNLLRTRHMLAGKPERAPWHATVGETTWLSAPAAGWLVPHQPAGALVAAGEVLARVHDATGHAVGELIAPGRGVVLVAPTAAWTEAQARLVKLGKLGPRAIARAAAAKTPPRHRCGWCEWVALPELDIGRLSAKIDTGARTSALHVRSMREVGERGGKPLLEVRLPMGRRPNSGKARVARVEVDEYIVVRDSGGHEERRPVITTTLALGPVTRRVRISLTDRGDMLFPMLVGRTALGEDFVVDAAARNLLS